MRERILIIGEAPSRSGDPSTPLQGAVGERLAEYAGVTFDEYLERTERHNLFSKPVEPWPAAQARTQAGMIWPSLLGRTTILLGSRVSAAFSITWPSLTWSTLDGAGTRVAIVPHPSGRNLWWNDEMNQRAARRFLSSLLG